MNAVNSFAVPMLAAVALLQGDGARGQGARATPATALAGPETTHVSADQVAGCAKASALATTPEYAVVCYNRTAPGRAEAHDGHAHIWYIIDGEATLVTGGTILDVRTESPGEPRGSGIEGGQSRRLVKGDVIVIPAGVPHQYTAVRAPVAYYSVNVSRTAR